jgi:hypothetical protein
MKLKVALPLMACVLVLGWWIGKEKVFEKKPPIPPKEYVHIQGQAFFVTPRGDSVKLGSVFVSLVTKKDFDLSLKKSIEANKADLKWKDDFRAGCRRRVTEMVEYLGHATNPVDIQSASEVLKLHNEAEYDAEDDKRATIEDVFSAAEWELPRMASAQTDGDGNFHIDSVKPSMEYYVLAHLDRTIMGQRITLLWAIPDYMVQQSPLVLNEANSYKDPPLDYLRLPKPKE